MVVHARAVIVAAVCLGAFTGCGDTFFAEKVLTRWCDGPFCGAPHSMVWKNPQELWLFDRPAARRVGGTWTKHAVCGELGVAVQLAADREATWAVCEYGDSRRLVRKPLDGAAVEVAVPSMPALVDLHEDVLFSWDDGFYAYDGGAFTWLVPPQPQRLGLWWGGRSRTDFYFEGKWWDGTSWLPVEGTSNLSREAGYVIDGRFCVGGRYRVEGTTVTDLFVEQGGPAATAKLSVKVFAAWGCERLWVLTTDLEEAVLSRLEGGRLVRAGTLPEPLFEAGPLGLKIAEWGVALSPDRVLANDRDDYFEVHVD